MTLIPDPYHPGKHIDTSTGIWPISEWGNECDCGWVSDARFARGAQDSVIKRANRSKTKQVYQAKARQEARQEKFL